MKQNIQALQEEKEMNSGLQEKLACFESTVNGLQEKLQLSEETLEKESEKLSELRHEYECNLGKLETEVDKWKLLHESLYLQYNRELRSWENRLSSLENDKEYIVLVLQHHPKDIAWKWCKQDLTKKDVD